MVCTTQFKLDFVCPAAVRVKVIRSGCYTAVSRKVVLETEKSLRDNVESYYG